MWRTFSKRPSALLKSKANYFAYLEEALALFLVRRHGRSSKERIVGPRKLYLIDTGLALFLPLLHASKRLNCGNLKMITLGEEDVEEVSLYGMRGRIELIPLAKWLFEGESLIPHKEEGEDVG